MGEAPVFTVRPLIPSTAALEGAFRVHIPVKDLEILGLKAGELCKLKSADGNTTGVGIAWRSTEQNAKPQVHPVKLTDTVRDAFGFKLGNQVTIQKSTSKIAHADRVVIVDVTDYDAIDAAKDDNNWRIRCENMLCMNGSHLLLLHMLISYLQQLSKLLPLEFPSTLLRAKVSKSAIR